MTIRGKTNPLSTLKCYQKKKYPAPDAGRMQILSSVVDADAKRLQKAHIVGVNREFRIRILAARAHQLRRRLGRLVLSLVKTDGGLKYQEDVIAFFFDPGDHLGNIVRLGK